MSMRHAVSYPFIQMQSPFVIRLSLLSFSLPVSLSLFSSLSLSQPLYPFSLSLSISPLSLSLSFSWLFLPLFTHTNFAAPAPCKPGQKLVNNTCMYCEDGTAAGAGASQCTQCDKGTAGNFRKRLWLVVFRSFHSEHVLYLVRDFFALTLNILDILMTGMSQAPHGLKGLARGQQDATEKHVLPSTCMACVVWDRRSAIVATTILSTCMRCRRSLTIFSLSYRGWRRGGSFVDSGVGHGRGASSWLRYEVDVCVCVCVKAYCHLLWSRFTVTCMCQMS